MYLEEIAGIFKVTEKTVRAWIAAGMPVEHRGSRGGGEDRDRTEIDLLAAVTWYFHENFERLELDRQRTRLAEQQADRLAMENDEHRGLLLFLPDVIAAKSAENARAATRLLQLPNAIGQIVDAATARAIVPEIRRRVGEALEELSSGDEEGMERPTDPDGESVGGREPETVERGKRRARSVAN